MYKSCLPRSFGSEFRSVKCNNSTMATNHSHLKMIGCGCSDTIYCDMIHVPMQLSFQNHPQRNMRRKCHDYLNTANFNRKTVGSSGNWTRFCIFFFLSTVLITDIRIMCANCTCKYVCLWKGLPVELYLGHLIWIAQLIKTKIFVK